MNNEELRNSFLEVFRNEMNNCVYDSELSSSINKYMICTSYWKALGVLNGLRNANVISDQINMSLYYDLTERYSEAYGKMLEEEKYEKAEGQAGRETGSSEAGENTDF